MFAGLPDPFTATRYHSLDVPADSLPDCLEVTAWVDSDEYGREIMGLQHREHPVHGVQFHPESFLTEAGVDLLQELLRTARGDVGVDHESEASARLAVFNLLALRAHERGASGENGSSYAGGARRPR